MLVAAFQKLTPQYREAVRFTLLQQGVTGFLCFGMDICGAAMGVLWLVCFLAFWVGFWLIWKRRRSAPSRGDIVLLRFGFIPLLVVGYGLFSLIWGVRGFSL